MSSYNFNYEYNNNQDGFQSSMDTSTNAPPKKDLSNQHLRPVTIKQIYNAQATISDGPFKLNGKNLDHISVIGKIIKSQTTSIYTAYTIEDGTGSIDVRIWIDTNDNDMELRRSQYGENVYIRVIGSVRNFNNKRSVMAFHIHLIEDYNEITSHFLEVIKINLEGLKNDGNSYDSNSNNQARVLPSFGESQYAPPTTNTNVASGFTPCQEAILNLIKSQTLGEEGMHKETIVSMLRGKFPENELRESIEFLVSDE